MCHKEHVEMLPTEEATGWHFDEELGKWRETKLAVCRCGNPFCIRPTSYYVDTDKWCLAQTQELRKDFDEVSILDAIETLGSILAPSMGRLVGVGFSGPLTRKQVEDGSYFEALRQQLAEEMGVDPSRIKFDIVEAPEGLNVPTDLF